ncbi:cellulase family glycosylhydrolase [Roseomonas aerophila]|uniref:cellulase n=1 Tax=Teichococcus aerophilus TaxID=1224513 RepID=A0ABR7RJU0_9PROT|nr:cellulase family glycosylhydrolase [Pseudoroseomonas aerophila]MBC9206807.1 cellulase family glycosylhydrolase [Pseudoroseomonas aerophila]
MAPFVQFRVTADWGDGFNGEITLFAGDDPLRNWSLGFLAPFTIDAMWTSGSITSVQDGLITVSGAEWNANVAAGKSATFGFTAARGDSGTDMPTAFLLDGAPVAAPSLSVGDVTVSEALHSLTFTVTLSSASSLPVSVDWGTADGSATAGADYVGGGGKLVFAPGQTSQTVTIGLLPDAVHEGRETFALNLSNVSGASINDGHAVATILDDDDAPNNGAVGAISTQGNQFVDANGDNVRIGAINWYGMETTRFAPDGLDQRNWMDMMDQMVGLGFNAIRLPFSSQALAGHDLPTNINYQLNPDLVGLTASGIMDKIVGYAGEIGMRVLLDRHRGEAGDGPNDNGLWYDATYTEQAWIDDWTMLATRYAGNPTVLGADLSNEPHAGTWGDGSATDWRAAAERAGNAILAANPDWLIVVEGTGWYDGEGYWWGGNLMGATEHPVRLNVPNRLVYSAHDYPPSLFPQSFFNDPNFPNNMPALFEKMWGHVFTSGTAPVLLGEFGSGMTDAKDVAWMQQLVAYLNGDFNVDGTNDLAPGKEGISWGYWAWNTNEGASTGILDTDWRTPVESKMDALQTLLAQRFPSYVAGEPTEVMGHAPAPAVDTAPALKVEAGESVAELPATPAAGLTEMVPGPAGTHEVLLQGNAAGAISLGVALGDVSLTRAADGHVSGMLWNDAAGAHAARFLNAGHVDFLDGGITFHAGSSVAAVEGLYHALLGRDGDVVGRSFWTAAVEDGFSLRDVADSMLASAEAHGASGAHSNDAFLGRLYESVLFRAADAGGLAFWRDALAHGESRADVAASFVASAEARQDPGGVAAAGLLTVDPDAAWIGFSFAALHGRQVAAGELASLLGQADAVGRSGLLASIMQGSEYASFLGAKDAAGFIQGLYEGVLHRPADAGGQAFFTAALASGTTRQDVAASFLASQEAQPYYHAYAGHGVDLL